MPSLNDIVTLVAGRLNRPFSEMLKAEIKPLFISELSLLLRRSIDANGIDAMYLASFSVELQEVDKTDVIGLNTGINILRSVNRIPAPIRYKSPIPFVSVTTLDNNRVLGYMRADQIVLMKELPNVGNSILYDYVNQYLYIYNTNKLSKVRITAPYINYESLIDENTGGHNTQYTDDMELPYPEDLLNAAILSLLQGILGNLDSKDKVVATHLDNE